MMSIKNYFKVLRPGLNTTFQDTGRKNLNHIGIPISGAMDKRNFLLANKLVGNNDKTTLEFAYQGPALKYFGKEIFVAVSGNVNLNIIRNNKSENGNCYQTYNLKHNDEIDIISTINSVYGYLSINNGFKTDMFFESSSTNTKAGVGGNNGVKLKSDDIININKIIYSSSIKKINYLNSKIEFLRIIKGPHYNYFDKNSKINLFSKSFEITKLTDRMGMRINGPKLKNIVSTNIKSEGIVKGVIQVPPDGDPIIMLSDHGTIGGYPKIANVISADYDRLVQLSPGTKIKFKEIDLKEAENLYYLYNLETQNLLNQIN